MTLVEFLHPLKRAGRKEQVLAVLYYLKRYEGRNEAAISEIRDALVKGRIRGAKTLNVAKLLGASSPRAHRVGPRGVWALTATGEMSLQESLGLPPLAEEADEDVRTLEVIAARIVDEAVHDYIDESIKCLRVQARRAAVVFLWTGAVAAIRDRVWAHGAPAIEAALQTHNPRSKFRKREDFVNVKDGDLLKVAQHLAIYDKSQKRRLGEALDLRNDCGHPAVYKPGEKKVASFVEDVVGIVWP